MVDAENVSLAVIVLAKFIFVEERMNLEEYFEFLKKNGWLVLSYDNKEERFWKIKVSSIQDPEINLVRKISYDILVNSLCDPSFIFKFTIEDMIKTLTEV